MCQPAQVVQGEVGVQLLQAALQHTAVGWVGCTLNKVGCAALWGVPPRLEKARQLGRANFRQTAVRHGVHTQHTYAQSIFMIR